MLTHFNNATWSSEMDPITEVRFNRIVDIIRSNESTNPDSFGFDELDLLELVMAVEDEFGFVEILDQPDVEACKTVGDLVAFVEKELEKCA